MGAYYTKEDITGYIARNTLIPYLFNAAEKQCAPPSSRIGRVAIAPRQSGPLHLTPPCARVLTCRCQQTSRPALTTCPSVTAGTSRRPANTPCRPRPGASMLRAASAAKNCEETSRQAGIHDINDLITYNLDLCQFAEDVIDNSEGPELLRAFYHAIANVSVLDPTCGSGAFLFAALNILEPLYEACLERMHAFLDDLKRNGAKLHPEEHSDFRKILEEVERHPNLRYFILKSIIVATFTAWTSWRRRSKSANCGSFSAGRPGEKPQQIEPLPDIDFNIRPATR